MISGSHTRTYTATSLCTGEHVSRNQALVVVSDCEKVRANQIDTGLQLHVSGRGFESGVRVGGPGRWSGSVVRVGSPSCLSGPPLLWGVVKNALFDYRFYS